MAEWIDIAATDELGPGQRKVVDVDGVRILVVNVAGTYYAVEDLCSHDGGQLDGGPLEGDQIVCPRHGARFSLKTGDALSPPAYDPIPTFPVQVQGGRLLIKDDRWD